MLLLVLLAAAAVGILDAYREIRRIGSGPIWEVPSRIYSCEFLIRPGDDIVKTGLLGRLERLRYRQVDSPQSAGEYSIAGSRMLIRIREFDYAGGHMPQQDVRLVMQDSRIKTVADVKDGRSLDYVVLEPEVIAEIFDRSLEDRTVVTLDECPDFLIDALIATEDRRFYEHHGIDLRSIVRAALVNMRHGGIVEGGSTITQQLIKNVFLTSKRSYWRKLKETVMALIMEGVYSKEDILEMYVNEVYMGQWGHAGIYGLGRASRLFFDKDISRLELEEAALLAGIIRAPNGYSPYRYPNKALARRNTVLALMLDEDHIDQDLHDRTADRPLWLAPMKPRNRTAPYFVDYLLNEIRDQYPVSALSRGGYRIFTTLDTHVQNICADRLEHGILNLEKTRSEVPLEGAAVVLDPASGEILAMAGGRDYSLSQYNRAVQIRRHIGSLIKPVVYYTALRRGYTLSSFVDEQPVKLKTEDGELWEPQNYDKRLHGRVMLRDALVNSYNVATVNVGLDVGLGDVMTEVGRLFPDVPARENPSVLLGALSCSPLDVARAYCAFANGGVVSDPCGIRLIMNDKGTVLYRRALNEGLPVLDESVVYVVGDALLEVVRSGTAKNAQMYGVPQGLKGKTGTTNDLRDSWFACFTPEMVGVVWLGNDDFLSVNLSGSSGAMPIASMIMAAIATDCSWEKPEDVVFKDIDPQSGKLASRWADDKLSLPYVSGTHPTEKVESDIEGFFKLFRWKKKK